MNITVFGANGKIGQDWTVVRIINPNIKTDGNGYTTSFGDTKANLVYPVKMQRNVCMIPF
ncbi:hypothetical protein DCE79_07380 [Lysinibacillus sp. 2017]|uniref:hypothetical protein n=1 Tax=unclassified Lysinibacillus TaxID=2636778 RepID=UPI000D529ADF|nr:MULTISPECIES: hypothetical protein [unclassified Lysinibacillus]AWE07215.1 hypothetical protein DCE79_07380 [Lysinibacillus sp. 2017]TGN34673.1 hypothetical protein E4L99_13575 [Lysinibacillus sp. S2017]